MPKVGNFYEVERIVAEILQVKQRKFLLDVWNDLVDATPVDTGKARASWFLAPGFPKTKELPYGPKYSRPAEPDVAKYDKKHTRWLISNTAHYISELNSGSSKQAPAGFVNTIIFKHIARANSG